MFCGVCGTAVQDGIFCPNCGSRVVQETNNTDTIINNSLNTGTEYFAEASVPTEMIEENTASKADSEVTKPDTKKKPEKSPEEKAAQKKKIKKIIIGVSVALVVMLVGFIAAIIGLVALLNPANKVIDSLENGEYDYAVYYYQKNMGEPNNKLVDGINERLDVIWEKFEAEEIDYYTAAGELAAIQQMDVTELSDKIADINGKVERLNGSRIAYAAAQDFENDGDYVNAIAQYRLVIDSDANYESAKGALDKLVPDYKDGVLEEAQGYAKNKDYGAAIEVLNDSVQVLGEDADIVAKITTYQTTYEKEVIAEADKLLKAKKFDEAETLLSNAKEILPDSTKIQEKLSGVDDYRPVDLSEMVLIDSKDYEFKNELFTDSFGYKYANSYFFNPDYNEETYAVFNLDKKYNVFKASVVSNPTTNSDSNYTVAIIVDGKVVKTVDEFTKTTGKINVEVDVTGVTKLEIRVIETTGEWEKTYISLVDATVSK